jgi:UDP-4-amino-4,6-dideoxy-N-acetyl-beta-L-altrosamine N-acetyltransferase
MKPVAFVSGEECRLTPLAERYLATVLRWRNAESIRKVMFTDHPITQEEHARWFAALQQDRSRDCQIFLHQEIPRGFSYFSHIDRERRDAEWGFYIDPTTTLKGLGRALGVLSMGYAFGALALCQVYTYTFEFNQKALRYLESLGFTRQPGAGREALKEGQMRRAYRLTLAGDRWQTVSQSL